MRGSFMRAIHLFKNGPISTWYSIPSKSLPILGFALVLSTVMGLGKTALGQQSADPATRAAAVSALSDDTRYRIGPGDVLEVRVLKSPELSRDAVRVDQRGMIRMPMLEDDIRAACLTETELGEKIATLYREYKR